ncbi:MAG: aldolase/citrate lyase family protein, partial [Thermoproteota archaeon]|nr:aldolase/citrate lyase family protein [Thermoproteota archaeon]
MKRDELVLSMSLRVGMGNPAIEVASKLGFDYVYFDFEHGVLGVETFAELVREARLAGLIALCRVPRFDAAFVNRVVDAGASGIVFPHVKTKQDAMRAVELTKYRTPETLTGKRGFEPAYGLPKRDGESWEEYFKRVNEETLVGLMIEDKEGVENIEEILSVKGIDFIYVGKMDMAFSYGVPFTPRAGRDSAVIEKAVTKICAECKKRGIPVRFSVGVAAEDIVRNVKRWLPKGRSHLFMVNDMALLMQGAEHYVNTLKKGLKK